MTEEGQVQLHRAIGPGAEPAGLMSSRRGSVPEFISHHLEKACPSTGIREDSDRRRAKKPQEHTRPPCLSLPTPSVWLGSAGTGCLLMRSEVKRLLYGPSSWGDGNGSEISLAHLGWRQIVPERDH